MSRGDTVGLRGPTDKWALFQPPNSISALMRAFADTKQLMRHTCCRCLCVIVSIISVFGQEAEALPSPPLPASVELCFAEPLLMELPFK